MRFPISCYKQLYSELGRRSNLERTAWWSARREGHWATALRVDHKGDGSLYSGENRSNGDLRGGEYLFPIALYRVKFSFSLQGA